MVYPSYEVAWKYIIMSFEKNRYVYVSQALDPDFSAFARNYTIFDETLNYCDEGVNGQVPGAHSKYGDPFMEALLLYLQPLMEEKTSLNLYPTYSYYRVYKKGNDLKPHVDRPACEISASLCLGYTDESIEWPLYVEDKPFIMKPGDMIIYRGMELNHYRYPLECDYSWNQSQVFLHYVDANGPHADQKFDGRNDLGTAKAR
jgi:hypothetical protein